MKKIIAENFPNEYILLVEGDGADVVPAMMNNFRFDHVFYTGGPVVGKIVYKWLLNNWCPLPWSWVANHRV